MPVIQGLARPSFTRLCNNAWRRVSSAAAVARPATAATAAAAAAAARNAQHRPRAFSSGGPGDGGAAMPPLRYREPIVLRPSEAHTATVIMLHGLGDSGEGWAPVGDEWAPALPHAKFVFPHAPMRPITINMGMTMPGWFDIASLEDLAGAEDGPGLVESKRYVESLLKAEEDAGISSSRVVVAGFSQGGAVALLMLRSERRLAGVVGLSTWLPLRGEEGVISPANGGTPIFQAHGDADNVVDYGFGVATHKLLKEQLGAPAEFITVRGMGHGASPGELVAVLDFLKTALPPV